MTRPATPARRTRVQRIMRENFEMTALSLGRNTMRLKIDHQQFEITLGVATMTKAEAKWLRKQMAVALCRFKFGD